MKTQRFIASLSVALAVSCAQPTEPTTGDLAGSWTAVTYETLDYESGEREEWLATGRLVSLGVRITAGGRTSITVQFRDSSYVTVYDGILETDHGLATFRSGGRTLATSLTVNGDEMTVTTPTFSIDDEYYGLTVIFRRAAP